MVLKDFTYFYCSYAKAPTTISQSVARAMLDHAPSQQPINVITVQPGTKISLICVRGSI